MRYLKLVLLAASLLLPVSISSATEYVLNGSFADGSDWSTTGDVAFEANTAILTDNDFDSSLFQPVPLDAGTYRLSFDFKNSLSAALVGGDDNSFYDYLFATLYFSNVASDDPDAFEGFLALFDLDFSGYSNAGGGISDLVTPGFSHFSVQFSLPFDNAAYAYAIPYFELHDANTLAGDSSVEIKNVSITDVSTVPEPGTLVSMGIGLVGLLIAGRKKFLA
jgi:hypothetical protein